MTIGLCTDSNSQLPPELARRYGVEVVPLTVVVDDEEFLEGVDLDADRFYELFTDARRPDARCSTPSAGQFAAAYDDLADRGCTQVLSIHTSHVACSTMLAARLAAHSSPIPVRLIDTGAARFGVSCCVWAAGDAIARGATLDEAAAVAESLAPAIGNVFIVGGLDLLSTVESRPQRAVLSILDGEITIVDAVDTIEGAIAAMERYTIEWGDQLHVAIGAAHRDTWPIADALAKAVSTSTAVLDVVHFRIGPSVGVEAGPGAVSCVMYPS